MPELPDLQIFSSNLTKALKGKKLKEITVKNAKKLNVPARQVKQALEGKRLKTVIRDGKELHFLFSGDNVLSLHLMLRGKLHWFEKMNTEKFTIIELLFDKDTGLALTDYQGQATPSLNPQPKPGIDALSKAVTLKFLKNELSKKRSTIKSVLLDQKFIRGIGNAYADEILWDCGISPFSVSQNIPDDKVKALLKSINNVLIKAEKQIRKQNPDLITGEVRDFLAVHNAKRDLTPRGEKILVDASGARKTYYTKEQIKY